MLPLISFSVLEHTGTHTHVHKHTSAHSCVQRKRDGENEREKESFLPSESDRLREKFMWRARQEMTSLEQGRLSTPDPRFVGRHYSLWSLIDMHENWTNALMGSPSLSAILGIYRYKNCITCFHRVFKSFLFAFVHACMCGSVCAVHVHNRLCGGVWALFNDNLVSTSVLL